VTPAARPEGPYFTRETFRFLRELTEHNDRDWFADNKRRYEAVVKEPALRLIQDFAPHLKKLSPHFQATPRSLFRIYRDVRFAKDKSPFKTHTGIQFRHDRGRDVHAPGYYFHVQPGQVFLALGLWHPDGATLGAIRERIVEAPADWKKASRGKAFRDTFAMEGDRLTRPPRGFDPEHPLVDDLKWKDFIATAELSEASATSADLPEALARTWSAGTPFMKFLCSAVDVPF
jgi:uncharacterized protein (TIGR02453 family)